MGGLEVQGADSGRRVGQPFALRSTETAPGARQRVAIEPHPSGAGEDHFGARTMSDSEHDDEFETYLKQNRPVPKGSSAPERLEPPAGRDRVVIGDARKAIQDAPPAHLFRAPKWALPAALATAILISFAILLDLSVRAQRAEHERQELPAKTAEAPTGARASSTAARAEHAATAAQPPPIQTAPWPPLPSPSKVASANESPRAETVRPPLSSATARTRLARVEVATTRSRTGSESAAREAAPDPAVWAAQIEKLRTEGQAAEVEQETKRFHQTYPGYALPAEAPSTAGRAQ